MAETQTDREWIESRYGPIREENYQLITVVAVPTYRGVALGIGLTMDAALADLRKDLSVGGPKERSL